jgi:hypothetical protein
VLAWLGFALAAFLAFGIAIWSQLTIGWQWSAPDAPATSVAMIVMSGAMVGFVIVALLSAIPIAWTLIAALVRRTRTAGSAVAGDRGGRGADCR